VKVLWFHSGIGAIGGGFKAMFYTLNELRKQSVDLSIVCTEASDVVEVLRHAGYPVILENAIKKWPTTVMSNPMWTWGGIVDLANLVITWRRSVSAARNIIRNERPDIIHLNMAPLVPAAVAAKMEGVPVVWHIREELNTRKVPLLAALNRRAIQHLSSAVISINQENLEQLGDVRNAMVIYDSVPLEDFDPKLDGTSLRKSIGCSDDTILVGALNSVSWIKGGLILVRAAKICLRANKKIMFLIVGEYDTPARSWKQKLRRKIAQMLHVPRYVERVMNEIREERSQGLFKFTGPILDVRSALAALDILVFPSMTSHSPLPAIEAAAMGKPVVASDWPAVREIVSHGSSGLLVPPGNSDALAEGILTLASDAERRVKMGKMGNRVARERFDVCRNTDQLQSVYRQVIRLSSA